MDIDMSLLLQRGRVYELRRQEGRAAVDGRRPEGSGIAERWKRADFATRSLQRLAKRKNSKRACRSSHRYIYRR